MCAGQKLAGPEEGPSGQRGIQPLKKERKAGRCWAVSEPQETGHSWIGG